MHIAFFHSSSDLYGSDRSLLRLVAGLRECGRTVYLPHDGPLVGALEEAGAEVRIRPLALLQRSHLHPKRFPSFIREWIRSTRSIAKELTESGVQVVHSNTVGVVTGVTAARRAGIPHVQHVRETFERPWFLARFVAWMAGRSARVVCVSHATRDNIMRFNPRLAGRTEVIHNGLDPAPFEGADGAVVRRAWGVPADHILIGGIGRLSFRKGVEFFVEAAERFATEHPDLPVRFAWVGSAPPGQEDRERWLKDRAHASGGRLIAEPFRPDIAPVIAALDIYTLSSTHPDSFPTTVLEAMAARKPVVVTTCGGAKEMVIENNTGLCVGPDDVQALMSAWLSLVTSPGARSGMGAEGYARLKSEFTPARHIESMRDLFSRVCHAAVSS